MNPDVQAFIDAIPADRRPLFDQVLAVARRLYPDAQLVLYYGVPALRGKSGWVAIGHWKGGASVYPNGSENVAFFHAEQPSIRTSKGAINFAIGQPLPLESLERVIHRAMSRGDRRT